LEEGLGSGLEEGLGSGLEEGLGSGLEEGLGSGLEEGLGGVLEEGIGCFKEESRALSSSVLCLRLFSSLTGGGGPSQASNDMTMRSSKVV
jgi:hypothetical protein